MEIKTLNFTSLNERQIKEILEWRNDPNVRRFSKNRGEITISDHRAFIEKLNKNRRMEYYLVNLKTESEEGGGVIHFNDITEMEAIVGLYKNPKSTIRGVGGILMDLIMIIAKQKRLEKLKLEALKNNERALVLYRKYDFKIISESEHSYYMEKYLRQ